MHTQKKVKCVLESVDSNKFPYLDYLNQKLILSYILSCEWTGKRIYHKRCRNLNLIAQMLSG